MFDRNKTPKQLRSDHGIRFHHLNAQCWRLKGVAPVDEKGRITASTISRELFVQLPKLVQDQFEPVAGALVATVVTMPAGDGDLIRVAAVFASEKERVVSRVLGRKEALDRLEEGCAFVRGAEFLDESGLLEMAYQMGLPPPKHFITLEQHEVEEGLLNQTILQHFDGGRRYHLAPRIHKIRKAKESLVPQVDRFEMDQDLADATPAFIDTGDRGI